ncbi:GT-D fold domain-containing glycosyltransferase [Cohnella luojiensis]|uniref:Succinyl-CoA synthetase n=1 Tax=Cohnella luojiensis TaxID=652876 RepID=A0A4Y8M1I5_9BACL|nr:GT-D fold domain-containing glycosyltransferase [Cohnella luojiensis]TFE27863.1 succinyl-CoA synthetase [Cohnella luojiensis]
MSIQSLRKLASSIGLPPKIEKNRNADGIPKKPENLRVSKGVPRKTVKVRASSGMAHKTEKRRVTVRRRVKSRKRLMGKKRRRIPLTRSKIEHQVENSDKNRSYDQGYQEGLTAGGEQILAEHIPADIIIPDITAGEAMAAGVQVLRKRGVPLLDPQGVYQELEDALAANRPYAFIRLGDGELLTLAQEKVLTFEEIRRAGPFLPYAGITVPNLLARDEMISCIQVASLIGVPMSRHPHFQPLLFAVLRAYGIDYRKLRFTTSTMNYSLHELGLLMKLLQGRKILVIGDVAAKLRDVLMEQGMVVTGIVTPVNGYDDVPRVVAEASGRDFDIALIAAGIPSIPIAVHLAGIKGKVTFDFGHLANRMAGVEHPARV